MKLFRHEARQATPETQRVYARFELARTIADFGAAFCFIIGSVMFFSETWLTFGTWLFLLGSVLFALKPTIKLMREVKLYRMGEFDSLTAD
ncbi:MAG: YrhK family protein [Sulfitobacter sp.]